MWQYEQFRINLVAIVKFIQYCLKSLWQMRSEHCLPGTDGLTPVFTDPLLSICGQALNSSFFTQVFLFFCTILNESNANLTQSHFCNIDQLNGQIGLKVLAFSISIARFIIAFCSRKILDCLPESWHRWLGGRRLKVCSLRTTLIHRDPDVPNIMEP